MADQVTITEKDFNEAVKAVLADLTMLALIMGKQDSISDGTKNVMTKLAELIKYKLF